MSLRPIKAMNIAGIEPANLAGAVKPRFEWVDPRKLLVDETYQRGLGEKSVRLVRKVVAEWDWAKFQPPSVVRTSAGLLVIDGQHTAIAAASHPGIGLIPVKLAHAPLTADQAGAFLGINRNRIAMTPMGIHSAAVVAGDVEALRIQRVAEAAGVRILRTTPSAHSYRPCDTVSIEAIRTVIKRQGEDNAVLLLKALAEAKLAPIGQSHIRAAEALMFDPEFGGVKPAAITSALISLGFLADQETRVFAATHGVKQQWRALAAVINRRIVSGRRPRAA